MHIEVEKADYKLQRLLDCSNYLNDAISCLEYLELQPSVVDVFSVLSHLKELRIKMNCDIIESRQELFHLYQKYHKDC